MRRSIFLISLLLVLLSPCALARPDAPVSAKVIAVIDGDTLLLMPLNASRASPRFYKLRLADIDAPELGQPFGLESKRDLAGLVLHQQVRVVTVATDRYGRRIGWISFAGPTNTGVDINTELVERGDAWASSRSRGAAHLVTIQQHAQRTRRGLWAEEDATPPWVWRKQAALRETHPASASKSLPLPLRN